MVKIKSAVQKTFILFVIACFFSFDKPKLVRMKVADNISVLLPGNWHPMDELDLRERYPSVRAPLAGYTNENRELDFSVNISATQWPDENVEMARSFFKASVYNMFDRVDMISEGIREVRGKKFIYFEFESYIKGSKELGMQNAVWRYTYLQYLVQPERSLVFSFNCPRRLRQEWQGTAREIMESIKVKA